MQPTQPVAARYRFVSVIVIAVVAGSFAAFALSRGGHADEVLRVSPEPVQRFTTAEGDVVSAKYTVKNVSGESVRIMGMNRTCGCMRIDAVFPLTIEPDATVILPVDMTVGAAGSTGLFRQQASFLLNKPGHVAPLRFEVEISAP